MANWPGYPAIRAILCEPGPGPVCVAIRDRRQFLFWMYSNVDANGEKVEVKKTGVWADILTDYLRHEDRPPTTPEPNVIALEPGVYGLDSLVVLRPTSSQAVEAGRKRYDVLVAASMDGSAPIIQLRGEPPHNLIQTGHGLVDRGGPPTQAELEAPFSQSAAQRGGGRIVEGGGMVKNSDWQTSHPGTSIAISSEFWDSVDTAFEARSEQTDEWTIPLPEYLIKAVRKSSRPKRRKPE